MGDKKVRITVGLASCGTAAGGNKVFEKAKEYLEEHNIDAELTAVGCIGMCYKEPLLEISDMETGKIIYGEVESDKVGEIIESHLINKKPIQDKIVLSEKFGGSENQVIDAQIRIVLRNCGIIDPESIEEYIKAGGYEALRKVLSDMTPQQVIDEIEESGLRGRGGAGFPTGLKWQFAYNSPGDEKYLICNADEGDPGAFMDRSILEGDPHSVLEGMIIAAYAIGTKYGFIYVRAEYPLAVRRLRKAIKSAEEKGFLGTDILNSGFDFELSIKEGAGAFVCGEETALMASIEGERGMPRIRPPYPANFGLWGMPTNINNVETYANVPWIILNGAKEFNKHGTEKSKGTKVFALAGKINKSGLVEVPMGITLREVIFDIGGGIKDGKKFKAVQLGGPSGGCVPEHLLDTKVDYDSLTATGAIMGSGGMVVMDENTCMVDIAKYFLTFTQNESCGKCTFCRIGTKRMLEILTRITEGKGKQGDIELLLDLADKIKRASLCGLGQTAPNPVVTTIQYFRDEYTAHINEKRCPAGVCKALITFEINDNCNGCHRCYKACPVNAISGEDKQKHTITQELCIKCGACYDVCKFDAIQRLSITYKNIPQPK